MARKARPNERERSNAAPVRECHVRDAFINRWAPLSARLRGVRSRARQRDPMRQRVAIDARGQEHCHVAEQRRHH
eukprot:7278910-Prymnesium_polylepis.3